MFGFPYLSFLAFIVCVYLFASFLRSFFCFFLFHVLVGALRCSSDLFPVQQTTCLCGLCSHPKFLVCIRKPKNHESTIGEQN